MTLKYSIYTLNNSDMFSGKKTASRHTITALWGRSLSTPQLSPDPLWHPTGSTCDGGSSWANHVGNHSLA